jgi:hypothetical protein
MEYDDNQSTSVINKDENMSNSKNVPIERRKWTKAERQYIQGIVHNLSMQRLTDQEIVQWLHDEKKIQIGRSTVIKIKNQIEQAAGNWYAELKQSRYLYLAHFKERIDTLYSRKTSLGDSDQ